ncbi:MAG: TIGR03013 family PEP-CTERM/XrtA system glycosyltransferase [Alphaproteobacteria bacterium]|nr:TIGR03013 family PEP-CTERM/XrtA system glycosyltransferase [Alphaproteobacteria bacterium]
MRLFGHYVGRPAISLVCLDVFLFVLLIELPALLAATEAPLHAPAWDGGPHLAMAAMAFLALSSVGLYNREVLASVAAAVSRALAGFPLLLAGLAGILLLTAPDSGLLPLAALVAVYLPLALLTRAMVAGLSRLEPFRRRVLVLGDGPLAQRAQSLVARSDLVMVPPPAPGDLARLVRERRVDEIVVVDGDDDPVPPWALFEAMMAGARVTNYASFHERETGFLDLDAIDPAWLVFSGFQSGRGRAIAKRAFDVVASLVILLLSLPVTVLTALAIRLDSPGPVFFRQERVGLGGRSFQVLKFRSMRTDAERDGVPRWADADDPRVTKVGGLIRKLRIDEIPQVLNVLKGDMSLIGPRPERPYFVEDLSRRIPFYDHRHHVKPGITGWAQVNYHYGASEEDARRKLAYDLYYLKNGSLFLDMVILVQTVRVVLWSEGAR